MIYESPMEPRSLLDQVLTSIQAEYEGVESAVIPRSVCGRRIARLRHVFLLPGFSRHRWSASRPGTRQDHPHSLAGGGP